MLLVDVCIVPDFEFFTYKSKSDDVKSILSLNLLITGEIMLNSTNIPTTVFTYLPFPLLGNNISIIVATITATIIPCAHELIAPIKFNHPHQKHHQPYIAPLFDIFTISVTPIISITDTLHSTANNNLNVSPMCTKSLIILPSAIG